MQLQTSAKDQLRTIVARIERLEEEKAALAADLREVYAEAKGNGFDVKALRAVISMRKQDENKRREEEAVLVDLSARARHGHRGRGGLADHHFNVMPGLVAPASTILAANAKTWVAGPSPGHHGFG